MVSIKPQVYKDLMLTVFHFSQVSYRVSPDNIVGRFRWRVMASAVVVGIYKSPR